MKNSKLCYEHNSYIGFGQDLVYFVYEKYDLKKVAEKEKAHDKNILSCVELNDGTIASGGEDCLIKLWED